MSEFKIHWSFWLICVFGLIWNAMSCMNFVMQFNSEMLSNYPDEARKLVETRPAWSTFAFAVAVFGGLVGDVLLILKRKLALYVFSISVLGVLLTNIHTIQISTSPNILVGSGMSLAIGSFFVWYVTFCNNKSWLS